MCAFELLLPLLELEIIEIEREMTIHLLTFLVLLKVVHIRNITNGTLYPKVLFNEIIL